MAYYSFNNCNILLQKWLPPKYIYNLNLLNMLNDPCSSKSQKVISSYFKSMYFLYQEVQLWESNRSQNINIFKSHFYLGFSLHLTKESQACSCKEPGPLCVHFSVGFCSLICTTVLWNYKFLLHISSQKHLEMYFFSSSLRMF